eukprot:TRINITY_DN8966_c0_g1_i5.p1 TRINITY_DN8966_c0_g1~~TRINITY_DN8966_c0_g1_i5.p1  ORF type:complete len:239 (-),score=59.06 TRINITY_DN8966_c0_g1_i5:167-883(-)
MAKEMCERMALDENETPTRLEAFITSLKRTIDEESVNHRPKAQIAEDLKLAKERYKTLKVQLAQLEAVQQKVQQNLLKRAEMWQKLLVHNSRRTKDFFGIYLAQRGFSGGLEFDHKNATLVIGVQPNNRSETQKDTRALSGGERSFSTVALLMALWEVMDIPFCAMDEFDVFMDAVTRKTSIKLLVEMGISNLSRQYLFITPGQTSQIPRNEYVRVHQMDPPERGQTTLSFVNTQNED